MLIHKAQALILLTCVAVPVIQALDQASLNVITNHLTNMFDNDTSMAAGMLRLSFHDCVGNACDGCIYLDNPDNAGLDRYINQAEDVYIDILSEGISLSRADFWAIAATQAVYYAAPGRLCRTCALEPVPSITYKTGRVDCAGSPWGSENPSFPSHFWGTSQVLEYFSDMFGFDAKETTAIMGAHTLGQAHVDVSGFIHPWVQKKNRFNNDYFIDLLNSELGWHQRTVGGANPKYQWESNPNSEGQRFLMLNSDISLIKDQGDITTNGEVSCTYDTCPATPEETLTWAIAFSNDNALFLEEFSKAFQKMISHGYASLNEITS